MEPTSATTVESATSAVEAAATMKSATSAMEAAPNATAREAVSAVEAAAGKSMSVTAPASTVTPASAITPTSAPAPASAPTPTTPAPAIPRTGADEETIHKPRRPVIAVWSASVRVIVVITVGAIRRPCIPGAHSHSHSDADLRLRIRKRQHQHRNQSQIFYVPHGDHPLVPDPCLPRNRICRAFIPAH